MHSHIVVCARLSRSRHESRLAAARNRRTCFDRARSIFVLLSRLTSLRYRISRENPYYIVSRVISFLRGLFYFYFCSSRRLRTVSRISAPCPIPALFLFILVTAPRHIEPGRCRSRVHPSADLSLIVSKTALRERGAKGKGVNMQSTFFLFPRDRGWKVLPMAAGIGLRGSLKYYSGVSSW